MPGRGHGGRGHREWIKLKAGAARRIGDTDGVADFVKFACVDGDREPDLYRLVKKTGLSLVFGSLDKPLSRAVAKSGRKSIMKGSKS